MATPLEKWQERLERHFEALALARAGSGFPLFALEHGLSEAELNEISPLLHSRLKAGLRLSPHWLCWVVYSTERGYRYKGDEYWPSFEESTPGWEFSDRDRIKPWFRKFQQAYHGVVPSGPWAEQFRIIAWPITHAILPRYLQYQFARALYDLRFHLASLAALDPHTVGRLLAVNAHHAPTRFQEFLQQEELTGRIVLALLGAEPPERQEPIYPPTLRRIVSDLEEVRSAREWLKETQRVVSDSFKGIGRGTRPPAGHPRIGGAGATVDATRIAVRPNLLLRHAGGGTWSVLLEMPSFRSVAALNADVQSFLQRTRCRLNGGIDMKPTGWLLSGNRKGTLRRWPDPARPLIQFERSYPALDQLLDSECRLSPGPIWLFRIASDGTAHEISGRIVRPGRAYIVTTTEELPQTHAGMSSCKLDCDGVKSFRLVIPTDVSAEMTAWLNHLGLQVARTIRVWPAGLPGRGWDGEGNSDWLTTEAPCFGMVNDHPIDAYAVCLNNGPESIIEVGRVGYPIFVHLDPLPVGRHTLTVKAKRSSSLDCIGSPPAEGFMLLNVREPEPWLPGVVSHPGLFVNLDPPDSDLDAFWRNEINLSVMGPATHTVSFTVSLRSGDGAEILREDISQPMELPVTPRMWREKFERFLSKEKHAWRYLEAASGSLTINGEELGKCVLRFEHDALPLRWVLRRDRKNVILRLVDDIGDENAPREIHFFSMERPLKALPLQRCKALAGIIVTPPGGLFTATHRSYFDTVVISTGLTAKGLQGLSVHPQFPEFQSPPINVARVIRILSIWQGARLSGFLANIRLQQVIDHLLAGLYGFLCGSNWSRAEAAFMKDPVSVRAIDTLLRAVDKRPSFAAVLRRNYELMNGDLTEGCRWFADLAKRYGVCPDPATSSFALKLASAPQKLSRISREQFDRHIREIRNQPAVLRGARLLALLSANQEPRGAVQMLPRWTW